MFTLNIPKLKSLFVLLQNERDRFLAQYGQTPEMALRTLQRTQNGTPNAMVHNNIHRASPATLNLRSDSPSVANGAPPALPPRSHQIEPPRVPPSLQNGEAPPPPPLPRRSTNNANPPPTPPRGTTPPPPASSMYSNSPITTSLPPPLMKRMSPVPSHASRGTAGMAVSHSQRGTSPVTTSQPFKVHNTREQQLVVQQQLQMVHGQANHIFPESGEPMVPPPPYPMGSAANTQCTPTMNANPPPSYSQSLAIQRQSPTLSSTSSDYRMMTSADFRRSPAPINNHILPGMASAYQYNGHGPSPIPASPSPSATSMISGSSRTSSTLQAARSATRYATQSPVIIQKTQSKQVMKPKLQIAGTPMAPATATAVTPGTPVSAQSAAPLPPPSYEKSIQENCPSPVITNQVPRTLSPSVPPSVPPPPPYPSTAVGSKDLVNPAQSVASPMISTAKVVPSNKPMLQRKYSPMVSEASSNSRSESPISDSQQTISSDNTVSCSPSSCNDITITDSGMESLMPPPLGPPPAYGEIFKIHLRSFFALYYYIRLLLFCAPFIFRSK